MGLRENNKIDSKKGKSHSGIKTWPDDDRPREKLFKYGGSYLSDTELLAILLRSGIKGQSAVDLARSIIQRYGTFRNLSSIDLAEWKSVRGIGAAKISQIIAAIEIGKRFREDNLKHKKPKIGSSKDMADILIPKMRDLKEEVLKIVLLNTQNRIIGIEDIAKGTANQIFPIMREVFHKALQQYAVAMICVHNHPSGSVLPSPEDKEFTNELVKLGRGLQIIVLDHIIISDNRYFSFADEGLF